MYLSLLQIFSPCHALPTIFLTSSATSYNSDLARSSKLKLLKDSILKEAASATYGDYGKLAGK